MDRWHEVADGVLVRRHDELDLCLGLVVGGESCLVVDTGLEAAHGADWARLVREVTALPWQVALTHAHFDHAFGTAAFLPCPVWAARGCREALVHGAGAQRDTWARHYRASGRPGLAERIAAVGPVPPDREVDDTVRINLGGRRVVLLATGGGHTDHDLLVHLPGQRVTFAGDLVEHGAPPAYDDADPAVWPAALDRLLALGASTIVPGHGGPVDASFVVTQRAQVAAVAGLCAAVTAGRLTWRQALRDSPYPEQVTRLALARVRPARVAAGTAEGIDMTGSRADHGEHDRR